jgi:hypothetical protein
MLFRICSWTKAEPPAWLMSKIDAKGNADLNGNEVLQLFEERSVMLIRTAAGTARLWMESAGKRFGPQGVVSK